MGSDHTWGTASGPGMQSCHMLGYRFPEGEGFQPTRGESYVLEESGGTMTAHLMKKGWYTDLWRSSTDRVHVTDADGFIQTSNPNGGGWSTHKIAGMLSGIWGLDDEHVYAWGLRGKQDFMVRWNGSAWIEMPSPTGGIVAIHGARPDLLVAVGDGGLIARWDGTAWTSMLAPSDEPYRSVYVVSDDEIWACGNRGALHQGTVHGWTPVLVHDAPLSGVAKWRDTLWVGAHGDAGICKLDGTKLEPFKPKLKAVKFETHDEALLFFSIGVIGETRDGNSFGGYRTKGFEDTTAGTIPDWD